MKLKDVAQIIAGRNVPKDKLLNSGDILYLNAKNIKDNELNLSSVSYVMKDSVQEKDILRPGDILLVRIGAGIGNMALFTAPESAVIGSPVFCIRSDDEDLIEKLKSKKVEIKELAKGTALLSLTISDLSELEI